VSLTTMCTIRVLFLTCFFIVPLLRLRLYVCLGLV